MSIRTLLESHIINKDYISIKKQGEDWHGQYIPLNISKTLLLCLSFHDFFPDGYEIIPLKQIVSITYSEVDAFFGDIVKKEGANALISNAPNIDLTDWASVFRFLMETQEIVSVDIGRDGCLDIGKVKSVFADGIEIKRFDATGVWEAESRYDSYEYLTGVEIRNHYVKTFIKYLPEEKGEGDGSSALTKVKK